MRIRAMKIAAVAFVLLLSGAAVSLATGSDPVNDLLGGLTHELQGGVNVPATRLQENGEPAFSAVPRPRCGPGSHPDPSPVDGRVPASATAGAARRGYTCNLSVVAHQGDAGGFKVWRYFDARGHECAYYDTALLYPMNAFRVSSSSQGVVVLDMSHPAHPVQTATLTSLPMLSPHESLNLNPRRGLLAADLGNPDAYPGLVSVYSIKNDCRHPVLDATGLYARYGHESAFSPDGTFWASGAGAGSVAAIDTSNPKQPKRIWDGNITAHGMNVSANGTRLYDADISGKLIIFDISDIAHHKPHPQVREISRLTWKGVSIPQNAIPFTKHGHPYLLEFDEYAFGSYRGHQGVPGGVRIIDIGNERHPKVISNIRIAVQQPAAHQAAANDPGAISPVQGYAAHYCNIPTRVNPTILACSMILSGLRVFNISNLLHPKEIAYYVAPPTARVETGAQPSDFAMSRPEFAPELRQVWYTDGTSGFYVLRLDKRVWPPSARPRLTVTESIAKTGRGLTLRVQVSANHDGEGPQPVRGALVTIAGRSRVTGAGGRASIRLSRTRRSRSRQLRITEAGYQPRRFRVALP